MIDGSANVAPAVARPAPPPERGRLSWPGLPAFSWDRLRHTLEHTIPHALTSPLALAWLFTIVTATVTMLQVRDYYLTHLPHFDSVGAYMYAFNVMNTTVTRGRLPGLILAA